MDSHRELYNFRYMKIIIANQSHIEALTSLFDAYRIFYKQPSDLDKAKEFLRQRMKKEESIIFLALDDSGRAIGFTQLFPSFSSVTMQRVYILNDLYVEAEFRGKGIGEALLDHAKKFAIQEGSKGLTLETATNNPAQKLYERLGWKKDTDVFHYTWRA